MQKKEYTLQEVLGWVVHLTAISTGALLGQLLLLASPALQAHRTWILLGAALLAWIVCILWRRKAGKQSSWYLGFALGATFGWAAFHGVSLLETLFEALTDLTGYEPIMDTLQFACPVLFGAIGALTYRNKKNKEDHNNG